MQVRDGVGEFCHLLFKQRKFDKRLGACFEYDLLNAVLGTFEVLLGHTWALALPSNPLLFVRECFVHWRVAVGVVCERWECRRHEEDVVGDVVARFVPFKVCKG